MSRPMFSVRVRVRIRFGVVSYYFARKKCVIAGYNCYCCYFRVYTASVVERKHGDMSSAKMLPDEKS